MPIHTAMLDINLDTLHHADDAAEMLDMPNYRHVASV